MGILRKPLNKVVRDKGVEDTDLTANPNDCYESVDRITESPEFHEALGVVTAVCEADTVARVERCQLKICFTM